MMKTTLQKFRDGLAANAFTLKEAAEATGIPYTTLLEMKREDYAQGFIGRCDALRDGLEKLSKKKRHA